MGSKYVHAYPHAPPAGLSGTEVKRIAASLLLRFSCSCLLCIPMNFTPRQMQNRRNARRSYRQRRQAQGWKMVQFYLPPDLAIQIRQSVKTRFARYRAQRQADLVTVA